MSNIKKNVLFLFISLSLGFMLFSCNKATYKKTKGGMPYQLFKGKDTQQIRMGDFIKIQITQKIKDSIYFTTVGSLPQYKQIDPSQVAPYDVSELWTSLHVGDSFVATQMLDTFINRDPQRIPPQFKKGDKIITYVKILAVFKSDTATQADFEKGNKVWLAGEVKTIEKFLSDKKITAQKTPSGAYVELIRPGTGNLIDSGKYVSIKYTGTSWSGKKFDSNTDTSFGRKDLLSYVAGTPNSMIKGFDEGVLALQPGAMAKFYIPSMLAYGGNPNSPLIKPFENLIFDIEIVEVKDKMPAQPTTPTNPAPSINR